MAAEASSVTDFPLALLEAHRLIRDDGGDWPDTLAAKDEMFGEGGPLEPWSLDSELVGSMLDIWRARKGST